MSIGRNIMVFISLMLFGLLCFVSGACYVKSPEGDARWLVIMASLIIVPQMFRIINAPTIKDEEKPKKAERKSRK